MVTLLTAVPPKPSGTPAPAQGGHPAAHPTAPWAGRPPGAPLRAKLRRRTLPSRRSRLTLAPLLVAACTGAGPGRVEPRVTGRSAPGPSQPPCRPPAHHGWHAARRPIPVGPPPAGPSVTEYGRRPRRAAGARWRGVVQLSARLSDGRANRLVESTFNRGTPVVSDRGTPAASDRRAPAVFSRGAPAVLPLGVLPPGLDAARRAAM